MGSGLADVIAPLDAAFRIDDLAVARKKTGLESREELVRWFHRTAIRH